MHTLSILLLKTPENFGGKLVSANQAAAAFVASLAPVSHNTAVIQSREISLMSDAIRFDLPQSAIPEQWYNVQADLPRPLPPVLHPGTHQPVGPDDLAPLFPMG